MPASPSEISDDRAIARVRRAARRVIDPVVWDQGHERLAAHPAFASCTRREIRQLRRAGDECVVPMGSVLCREDRIGYFFFAIGSGSVRLTRHGKDMATLGPGSHLGEVAVLGFGPQPMTATAMTDTAVFVLGRKPLLDLTALMPSFQRGLYPELADGQFATKVRGLRAEGSAEWRLLPQGRQPDVDRRDALPSMLRVFPAKGGGTVGAEFMRLSLEGGRTPKPAELPIWRMSRRALGVVLGLALSVVLTVGFGYHPGVLVVHSTPGIDITDDVRLTGTATRRPTGRYVLTAVSLAQPTLFGAAIAAVRGEPTVPRSEDVSEVRVEGRRQFAESRRLALTVVAGEAGLDVDALDVTYRERKLFGPSAGLVYALLLADITGRVDLQGQVVAATGVLGPGGRVLPVSFVAEKAKAASSAGATFFVVPSAGHSPRPSGRSVTVVPVASFDDALRSLENR